MTSNHPPGGSISASKCPLRGHAHHITNVREDGTIPQFEQPWWQSLNTFRTNSQIEGGEVCQPIPQ